MRVLITGAGGFVGRWLTQDLKHADHQAVSSKVADVRDGEAMAQEVQSVVPDAIVHLAAVAFGPDARDDSETAFSVAVAGTARVMEAARLAQHRPIVLVVGSSEAYGTPRPDELPIDESTPLRAESPYGVSKIAQESVALAYAHRYAMDVIVTRSFNHVGPGQRPQFVVPSIVGRVQAVKRGEKSSIRMGNVDVRRDLSDVRDVVRAYRLLLERCGNGFAKGGLVVNVCSGQAVSIRWLVGEVCRLAGIEPRIELDPALVRGTEAPEIRGDPRLIEHLTGWQPTTPLLETLRDIWRQAEGDS